MQSRERFLGTFILFGVICFGYLTPQTAHGDDECYTSQGLIVLDKSSSMMNTSLDGESTNWAEATEAIDFITGNYEESIDFGLMIFPYPNQCNPGEVVVEMAPNNGSAIQAALGDPPPEGGNWTPMAESLEAAANYDPLQVSHRPSFVLLITDGWQWCDPYDPATRFDPVGAVEDLAALGIPVYVVGFTYSVDALALNRMAVAGGTAQPNCDETSDNPEHPQNCYYQAVDFLTLTVVLEEIALEVVHDRPCGTNEGECSQGIQTCRNGVWGDCYGETGPTEEICDGLDNNCNGITDEGCDCVIGETRPCGISIGECEEGVQVCDDEGIWSDYCDGAVGPSEETCDGLDNDCDGTTDEDLTRECETDCGVGVEVCVNGNWYGCSARQPTEEVCDGVDNDCNGIIDDGDNLCGPLEECIDGECVPIGGQDAGVGFDAGSGHGADSPSSCGCRTPVGGTTPPLYLLSLLALLGLAFAFRRKV